MSLPCFVPAAGRLPWISKRQRRIPSRCARMTAASTESAAIVAPEDWDIRLKSPCKINLFLRILDRRKDGFHELASLFQAISLHDNLSVSKAPEGAESDTLSCDMPGVPTDESNLVMMAFDTFRKRTGSETYFRARLDKNIPHGAGLGGGSGNAATALWAANKLTGENCSDAELAEFGAEFGSDISFFFTNGSAYCTGRGDKLMEIPRLNPQTLYIVKPEESLSTKDVFNKLDIAECKQGPNPQELLSTMQQGVIFADFVNDLEKPSFELLPRLKTIKNALIDANFNVVMMSGSGTSFFCLGHPNSKDFFDVFPEKYNVKVIPAMFACRRFPGRWYFEMPPLEELKTEKEDPWKLAEAE